MNVCCYSLQEKPSSSKTPQSAKGENKTLKRKLFPPGANSEDEGKTCLSLTDLHLVI